MLRAAGCEVVQGYLYGMPAPLMIHNGAAIPIHPAPMPMVANLH
jgi:hypothetical protein